MFSGQQILTLFLILIMELSLASCGAEGTTQPTPEMPEPPTQVQETPEPAPAPSPEPELEVTEGTETYRGFQMDNVLHAPEGDIHYHIYVPETYDGSEPYALFLTLPGYEGLKGLNRIALERLMEVRGVGQVKAVQLKCVAELAARMARAEAAQRLAFDTPETIADYFMEDLRYAEQEQLHVLFLNTRNKLLKEKLMFKGTVNASLISPREIFMEALTCHAVRLVLVHNHPSGDPAPSPEDVRMTHRIYKTGEMLGIQLLDHIIIGDHCYSSFRERGILSEEN